MTFQIYFLQIARHCYRLAKLMVFFEETPKINAKELE